MPIKPYLSASQYRRWLECPAAEYAAQTGQWTRPETDAMTKGKYVDIAILGGDMDAFLAANPDMFSTRGERKGELKAAYANLQRCIDRVGGEPKAMRLLTGEAHVAISGNLGGCDWIGELDCLPNDPDLDCYLTDLKKLKDFRPEWATIDGRNARLPWYERYWLQMAVYWHLTGRKRIPVLVAVTEQDPPGLKAVILGDESRLASEIADIEQHVPTILQWKSGAVEPSPCESDDCAYCRGVMFKVEEAN